MVHHDRPGAELDVDTPLESFVTSGPDEPPLVVVASTRRSGRNPYAATWTRMLVDAGATVIAFGVRNVLRTPRGPSTVVHLQWPEFLVAGESRRDRAQGLVTLAVGLVLARVRHNRVLTTFHNLAPHDGGILPRAAWFVSLVASTDVHMLSESSRSLLPAAARRKRIHYLPHVAYEVSGDGHSRSPFVDSLELNGGELLAFGEVRAYKGFEALAELVANSPVGSGEVPLKLVVAGACRDETLAARLRAIAATSGDRVRLILEPLDDDDLVALIRAAALAVLPFSTVLNSGSVLLSLSAGTPVLVPQSATFTELQAHVGPGWVSTYDGPLPLDLLIERRDRGRPTDGPDLSWCSRARLTADLRTLLRP